MRYIFLGHAAGVAVTLAAKSGGAVQEVNIADLQRQLREEGAVFEYSIEENNKALAAIRKRYAAPARKGPSPWSRQASK